MFYKNKYIFNSDKNMIIPHKASLKLMHELQLPIYNNNRVHFKDVIIKLTSEVIKKNTGSTEFENLDEFQRQRLERQWNKTYK